MASSFRNGGSEAGAPTEWNDASRGATRAQLARLLDSSQFRSSKRCSTFLRHVVEHAIEHRLEFLKERTIGVEVFERDPDYDTNQDPVVRSTAGEVRKRLAQYYLETGHEEELRISLPTGSYIPEFHALPGKPEPPPPPPPVPAARRPLGRWVAPLTAMVVLAAAVIAALMVRETDLDRFWDPVLQPPGRLLICVGQPRVYKFNDRTQERLNRWFESGGKSPGAPPPPPPVAEIVPMWDRYLALGDAQSFTMLADFFGRRGKKVDLRGGHSVSLADLRGRPVLLIGAFNNEWTLNLAGELRFYFEQDSQRGNGFVRDRQNPAKMDWEVNVQGPLHTPPVDYALVTRVRNATTEQTVVIAAGITQSGTQAAGEFLTTPAYFAQALRDAPRDWRRKNMQIVLSAKVLSGTAGPPQVQAVHFW